MSLPLDIESSTLTIKVGSTETGNVIHAQFYDTAVSNQTVGGRR